MQCENDMIVIRNTEDCLWEIYMTEHFGQF